MSDKRSSKRANFVAANEKAKSEVVVQFVRIARKARLSYDEFLYISQQARKKLGLHRSKKERRLQAWSCSRQFPDVGLRNICVAAGQADWLPTSGARNAAVARTSGCALARRLATIDEEVR